MSVIRLPFEALSRRVKLLAMFNVAFFVSLFFTVLVAEAFIPSTPFVDQSYPYAESYVGRDYYALFVVIFAANLFLSAFVVVTLSGALFFPLSFIFLMYRAASWGLLVYQMPSWLFLISLPVLVFEGEAYVIAAVAGTLLGISWVRPRVLHHDELTRKGSLKMILKECFALYWIVTGLLLAAATIETAIIIMLSQTFT
jgi:hypothetical protein